jgi:hypothetical protein
MIRFRKKYISKVLFLNVPMRAPFEQVATYIIIYWAVLSVAMIFWQVREVNGKKGASNTTVNTRISLETLKRIRNNHFRFPSIQHALSSQQTVHFERRLTLRSLYDIACNSGRYPPAVKFLMNYSPFESCFRMSILRVNFPHAFLQLLTKHFPCYFTYYYTRVNVLL